MPGVVIANINVGILYLFAISSLGVYGIIMAGWASNSHYAFLGALRSAAQMVSYEVSIGFVMVTVLLCVGSLNLSDIVDGAAAYLVRDPAVADVRDLLHLGPGRDQPRARSTCPRARSELVAGYFVEYSAMAFALFYLGEYANMILMSAMTSVLFLGGWLAPFGVAPFTWVPGSIWFAAQDRLRAVLLPLGARDLPALPLRPADAAGLEGVSAVLAVLAGADRGRA